MHKFVGVLDNPLTNESLFYETMFRYLSMDITCYEKRTLLRARLEQTLKVQGTENFQG